MSKKIKAVIIGASGFTGAEIVRILLGHPHVEIAALVADSNAGKKFADLYPQFAGHKLPTLCKLGGVKWDGVEAVFCCLPHATSQEVIAALPKNLKIFDLSADFRIRDVKVYEKWYNHKHSQPELQKEAVYGLTEVNRDKIAKASLVACPGCYPTSILLPLIPLLEGGIINPEGIIVDSKSGYSGAGAKAAQIKEEIYESMKTYGLEGHRHVAEIEQELTEANGGDQVTISFTPLVVPIFRGMVSDINVVLADGQKIHDVKNALQEYYNDEKFVKILSGPTPMPSTVNNTNNIEIAVYEDRIKDRVKIISAIDNLVKGASGQAVQNMNLVFGFDEAAGLKEVKKSGK